MTSGRSDEDPGQNTTHPLEPKSRGRVERLIAAMRVLERDRKIRKADLLALAGVGSHSSFKRIKAELKTAGLPLTYFAADGYYHVPPNASIARFGIDTRTRAQLAQVRAAINALGGVAQEALGDVLEVLEARVALDDHDAVAVVTSRHPSPRGEADFFANLDRALSAVRERRWLSFAYVRTAGGEDSERTIAPYAVHVHDGRYYVWGTLEGDTAPLPTPRLFALDRMSDVRIEDDAFAFDSSLDLSSALRYSFGTMVSDEAAQEVVIQVNAAAAAFVACRRWPAEVASRYELDGSLRMTFLVSKIDELVAWVLSFGGEATIVSPTNARDDLKRRAEAIARSVSAA